MIYEEGSCDDEPPKYQYGKLPHNKSNSSGGDDVIWEYYDYSIKKRINPDTTSCYKKQNNFTLVVVFVTYALVFTAIVLGVLYLKDNHRLQTCQEAILSLKKKC